jgi:hypothetical protein
MNKLGATKKAGLTKDNLKLRTGKQLSDTAVGTPTKSESLL